MPFDRDTGLCGEPVAVGSLLEDDRRQVPEVGAAESVRSVVAFDSHITGHGMVVKRGEPWMGSGSESGRTAHRHRVIPFNSDTVPPL